MQKMKIIMGGNPIFLLIVIANIIVIMLGSYLWVYPAVANISDLHSNKSFWEQKNREQDNILAEIKEVENEWAIWQERKKAQVEGIPLKGELDDVFQELDLFLEIAPIEVSSFSSENREFGENDKFSSIGFKLLLNGTPHAGPAELLETLKDMEEFKYPLSVKKVSFYREKGSEELQMEVSFKIYFHSG